MARELSPHSSQPHFSPLDRPYFRAVKLFGVLLLKEEMRKQKAKKAKKYGLCLLTFKGQVFSGKTHLSVWVPDEGKCEINTSKRFLFTKPEKESMDSGERE